MIMIASAPYPPCRSGAALRQTDFSPLRSSRVESRLARDPVVGAVIVDPGLQRSLVVTK
jgi:hypothetical protein